MTSCVDELENQRRELEARRAMLEERFKLRLATAQVSFCANTFSNYKIEAYFIPGTWSLQQYVYTASEIRRSWSMLRRSRKIPGM